MPAISEFFGLLIYMYYNDHAPPHFHARYGEDEMLMQITSLGVLKGKLPSRALSLVMEWAQIHQNELLKNWNYATDNKKLHKIPPLQ